MLLRSYSMQNSLPDWLSREPHKNKKHNYQFMNRMTGQLTEVTASCAEEACKLSGLNLDHHYLMVTDK